MLCVKGSLLNPPNGAIKQTLLLKKIPRVHGDVLCEGLEESVAFLSFPSQFMTTAATLKVRGRERERKRERLKKKKLYISSEGSVCTV